MARQPRIIVPGQAMHIIQRGNNRQAIFFCDQDYRRYLETLEQAAEENACRIHAYVLMTNHVHLLVTPTTSHGIDKTKGISQMMQGIGRSYVRYINAVYKRSGTLWEGRYKSALIDSESYLLACSRYIELNPVRASIVQQPEEYPWSSYHSNAGCAGYDKGKPDRLLTQHHVYKRLGNTQEQRASAYKQLFKAQLDNKLINTIRHNTEKGLLLGNSRFEEEIQNQLKRRVGKFTHGGDRKGKTFDQISSALTP